MGYKKGNNLNYCLFGRCAVVAGFAPLKYKYKAIKQIGQIKMQGLQKKTDKSLHNSNK